MSEATVKRFIFSKKSLSDPADAQVALRAFISEIADGAQISMDLSQVEELSDAYADSFFGEIAAEIAANGVAMHFEFKDGLGFEFSTRIREAMGRALPPSLGGHATVH